MKNKAQKPERERWERRGSRKFTHLPRASSMKALQPVKRPLIESSRPAVKVRETKPPGMTKLPKQVIKSPTKIPIRNSSSNNRFVKLSNEANLKTKKPDASPAKTPSQLQPQLQRQSAAAAPLSMKSVPTPLDSPLVTDESVIMGGGSGGSDNSIQRTREDEEEMGLVDLLKQSSGASGTSSVVNATTTTAVQPLRIDAATILPQPEGSDKHAGAPGAPSRSSNPPNPSNLPKNETSLSMDKSQTVTAVASVEPVKPESLPQPSKSPPKQTVSKAEVKTDRDEVKNPVEVDAVQTSNPLDSSSVIDETIKSQKTSKAGSKVQSNRTSPRSMGNTLEADEGDRGPGQGDGQGGTTAKDKLRNHGSEVSLKSSKSNGLSTGSGESIRSTDTGVSLNTVRGVHGVSSAREKRGTHTVKRENEIETLSGNVMQFDRGRRAENGEPA